MKNFFLVLLLLPFLASCQQFEVENAAYREEKIPCVMVTYEDKFTKKKYEIVSSVDVAEHVESYFDFLERYNLDITPMERLGGVMSTENFNLMTKDTNNIGITNKAIDSMNISASVFLKKQYVDQSDSLRVKVMVWHELTHVITNNRLPHCKDYVNCSAIFNRALEPMMIRYELFWELEEYKLANMIKVFQRFPPHSNYMGFRNWKKPEE